MQTIQSFKSIPVIDCEVLVDGNWVYGITHANLGAWTSKGFCTSANIDLPKNEVQNCREALAKQLGFARIVTQLQVHGTDMQWVDMQSESDHESDALLSQTPGLLLAASVADCAGIVVYHPSGSASAVVHSGWRGTQQNIVAKAVQSLCEREHSTPSELRVWCSPCASGRQYKVQQDVQQFFVDYCTECAEGEYLFDNQSAIVAQLIGCGIDETNIARSNQCTIEDLNLHSFRRDGKASGRMTVFVGRRRS